MTKDNLAVRNNCLVNRLILIREMVDDLLYTAIDRKEGEFVSDPNLLKKLNKIRNLTYEDGSDRASQ